MKKILSICLLLLLSSSILAHNRDSYPRGIRNNNPGNLIITSIPWRGKKVCSRDKHFECFSSPYYGIRAMMKTIKTYIRKHKVITFDDFFNRWAPTKENNTKEIVRYFNTIFPNTDMYTIDLKSFINELIYFENGSNPYSYILIEEVYGNVFTNSSRNNNNPWRSISGGFVKNMGNETTGTNRTKQILISNEQPKRKSPRISKISNKYSYTMDKKNNCINRSFLRYLATETSSLIHRYNYIRGMDRMGIRFPILYGREGSIKVEGVKRSCYYSP